MPRKQTTRAGIYRLWGWAVLPALALGLAFSGPAAAQKPPGLPSPANPPPGAPAPQPHVPAGGADSGEGLRVEPESPRVTGRIVRIEENRITLETNDTNEEVTFAVDARGDIVLNKETAELRDLRPGDFVRLTLTAGEKPQAEMVWAARVKAESDQPDQYFPPAAFRETGEEARRSERRGQGRIRGQMAGAGGLGVVVTETPGVGVMVVGVRAGTPAAQAGLYVGDYIVGIDNRQIQNGQQFIQTIQSYRPGAEAVLTVWSQNQQGFGTAVPSTTLTPTQIQSQQSGAVGQANPAGTANPAERSSFGENSSQFGNLPFESPESGTFGSVPFEGSGSAAAGGAVNQGQAGTGAAQPGATTPIIGGPDAGLPGQGQANTGPSQIQGSANAQNGAAVQPGATTPTISGAPAATTPIIGNIPGSRAVPVVFTTAEIGQDSVVNGLGQAPFGQAGFVNSGFNTGFGPGVGVVPFGGTGTTGTVDGQQPMTAEQIQQEIRRLQGELNRRRDEQPDQTGQPQPFPMTTPPGSLPQSGNRPGTADQQNAAPRRGATNGQQAIPGAQGTTPPATGGAQPRSTGRTQQPPAAPQAPAAGNRAGTGAGAAATQRRM